ncbi:MAG: hypothetical protein JW844_05715 [Candidatus Omnitrophica bacterium]|nr:hypothetical protein [Candidatus Omnitrophota bacterium]
MATAFLLHALSHCAFSEGPFLYDAKKQRDPFVPLLKPDGTPNADVYGPGSIEELNLEGIAWDSGGEGIAIINGNLVKEGDKIGNITIVKITKEGVQVEIDGELFTCFLQEDK